MSKSLYSYILKNYIKSKYATTILKVNDLVHKMYITIGEEFNLDEGECIQTSDEFYFYDLATENGKNPLCYLGYNTGTYSGVYMDESANLYFVNYMTRKVEPITQDMLVGEQLNKYQSYLEYLDKGITNSINLLGVINDVKYFYDNEGNFYDTHYEQLTSDNYQYKLCSTLYNELKNSLM